MKYIYIIRSLLRAEQLYVGITSDYIRRIKDHSEGKCFHTSKFRPWVLIYSETFENDSDAFKRERQIKKWSQAKKEALIAADKFMLKKLAKRRVY